MMQLSMNPHFLRNSATKNIPTHLAETIVPWSDAEFTLLDHGSLLRQQFECRFFTLNLIRVAFQDATRLYMLFEEPTVALHFAICGDFELSYKARTEKYLAGNFGLTFIPKEICKISVSKDTTEIMFIEILPTWLEDISLANEQVLSLLENKKNDEHILIKIPETPIDYFVANSLQNLLTCDDIGPDLIMELKTIILNFLNFYRKSIKDTQYLSSLPFVPHKEELINIWKKIKSNPNISEHRVSQLSKENYLHEKTLNRNFRKLFDQDISSFVQEHCMNKGYHLITNTRINIDDIAFELGYKESSSFNRAFKRRFKTAPQSFRNAQLKISLSENEKKLSANDNNS